MIHIPDKPSWDRLTTCKCGGKPKMIGKREHQQVRFFIVECEQCKVKTGVRRFTRTEAASDWERLIGQGESN